jgi:hypothetical protein
MPRKLNLGETMKIILLALVFILVLGCSTTSTENISQSSMPKVEKQVLQKGIFLNTDAECEKNDNCLCKADINYPVVSGLGSETAQIEINKKFKKSAKYDEDENSFEYLCDGKLINTTQELTYRNYKFFANYEVTFNSSEILGISIYREAETGGMTGPMISYKGFIINVQTGKELSAKDIFGENINQVNQIIYEKLITIESSDLDKLKERKGKFIEGDICNDCSLFLSKEGIKIIWGKYTVAFGVAGNPDVLIPNKYITYPAITNYFK